MDEPDNKWEQLYQGGFKPWDTGRPDSHLVRFVADGGIRPRRALDVGCGTGTNAIWLAEHGFAVTGIDVSPTALALAKAKPGAERCDFALVDFFDLPAPADPFGFVFDLGCFHIFHEAAERTRFARRVFECLAAGGLWLSLSGNADGQHVGIPTRTAADIVLAAESCFEIVSLSATRLDIPDDVDLQAMGLPSGVELRGWSCVMRKRG
ncbi:MAG: class I SAM-dependent methyltransferase [Candidatus Binatia bacterium]